MKNWIFLLGCLAFIFTIITSCDDDQGAVGSTTMVLQFNGLTVPGGGYVYGVWLHENETYAALGEFTFNSDGNITNSLYSINKERLAAAQGVLITLEREGEIGSAPSSARVLSGDFINKGAQLTVHHSEALGEDFTTSSASYVLATPTDLDSQNEFSGLWYYDTMNTVSTLDLPALPSQWIYESWVVVSDSIVSMGKFSDPAVADQTDQYGAGLAPGYPAPGEDFLMGKDIFPADLREGRVFISVEPVPDDAVGPFGIRPFVDEVVDTIPIAPVPMEYVELGLPRGLATRG